MDTEKIGREEIIGIVAGLILILSLFLPWYSLDTTGVERDEAADWVCGTGNNSCSGFDTFPIMRWLLIGAAVAPLILSYILARGHTLSWPRGELTAIVGITAFVLIAYNGLVDKPSPNDIGVNIDFGYWIALLASLVIFAAGGLRAVESGGGAQRKPPATF